MASLIKEIQQLKESIPLSDCQLYHLLLAKKTREIHAIQGITLELTPLCTLNCKMCYVHKSKEQYEACERRVSTERFIQIAEEAAKLGAINATITGGEAMMHPDFIRIYKALYEMGLLITVMSNATVVTDDILDLFKECPPSFVNITLYGYSEETYLNTVGVSCFNRVIKNILKLKQAGIPVRLQSTVTKDMEHDLNAIAGFAKENDIAFNFNTILKAAREFAAEGIEDIAVDHAVSDVEEMNGSDSEETEMKYGMNCGAGSNHFHVTWDGYMQPCATFDMIREDILEKDVESLWKSLSEKVSRIPKLMKCENCEYKNKCESCYVTHYGDTKEFGKVSPRLCYKIQHGIK